MDFLGYSRVILSDPLHVFIESSSSDGEVLRESCFTQPNLEIICGQNVGPKVVCGMIFFFEKKGMLKI